MKLPLTVVLLVVVIFEMRPYPVPNIPVKKSDFENVFMYESMSILYNNTL